jgi:hypothetical protein
MSTSVEEIKKTIADYERNLAECQGRLPVAKAELEVAVKASTVLFNTQWGTTEHEDAVRQEGCLEDEVKSLQGQIQEFKNWITTEAAKLTAAMSTEP